MFLFFFSHVRSQRICFGCVWVTRFSVLTSLKIELARAVGAAWLRLQTFRGCYVGFLVTVDNLCFKHVADRLNGGAAMSRSRAKLTLSDVDWCCTFYPHAYTRGAGAVWNTTGHQPETPCEIALCCVISLTCVRILSLGTKYAICVAQPL